MPPVLRRLVLASTLAALPWLTPVPVASEETPTDPVVATVDGAEIRLSDVARDQATLPEQYRQLPIELLFEVLRSRAVETALLAAEADRRALDDDPDVQRTLAEMRKIVLRNSLVERTVDEAVTEDALRAAYDARASQPGFAAEQVRASHILVASEDEAKALLQQLADGAAFADLAREHSLDPAGANGGDLGYFVREQMVEPFAEAAFAMDVGSVSSAPVQTQFGWHVIQVQDRRTVTPTFEDLEPELREEVGRAAVTALLEGLKAGATIEEFGMDGAPVGGGQ